MMGKKYYGIVIAFSVALLVTSCGSTFPELTETEYNQTVEYAVGLLMKHSNNDQEKLTYVNAKEVEKQRRKAAEEEEKKNGEKKTEESVSSQPQPQTTTPVTPSSSPNTPAENNTEETTSQVTEEANTGNSITEENTGTEETTQSGGNAQTDPEALVLSSDESQEIAPDIFISYEGYSVSSTFPESSKSYVINAEKGKKLLVLRFDLYNGSDSDKSVNILEKNILFQVLLNDKNVGYTAVTVLPNDLSSYVGTIESRAHESLVVLAEIKESEATSIESLGLVVSMGENKQTVYLK